MVFFHGNSFRYFICAHNPELENSPFLFGHIYSFSIYVLFFTYSKKRQNGGWFSRRTRISQGWQVNWGCLCRRPDPLPIRLAHAIAALAHHGRRTGRLFRNGSCETLELANFVGRTPDGAIALLGTGSLLQSNRPVFFLYSFIFSDYFRPYHSYRFLGGPPDVL